MHIVLRDQTGRFVDGILLSATPDKMRLVLKDENDTLELNLVNTQWFAEGGSPVEIESLLTDDASVITQIWSEARPRVFTVGN